LYRSTYAASSATAEQGVATVGAQDRQAFLLKDREHADPVHVRHEPVHPGLLLDDRGVVDERVRGRGRVLRIQARALEQRSIVREDVRHDVPGDPVRPPAVPKRPPDVGEVACPGVGRHGRVHVHERARLRQAQGPFGVEVHDVGADAAGDRRKKLLVDGLGLDVDPPDGDVRVCRLIPGDHPLNVPGEERLEGDRPELQLSAGTAGGGPGAQEKRKRYGDEAASHGGTTSSFRGSDKFTCGRKPMVFLCFPSPIDVQRIWARQRGEGRSSVDRPVASSRNEKSGCYHTKGINACVRFL